ncbi:MAG: hypothetical protein OXU20_20990 [Myxococcales bacterium]|nr:hypothetical protein [Myxococcales bacterium]MDD9970418.1 hypothetical protein [Myxococcales bacterium]
MAVLSDETLREEIRAGRIVLRGDEAAATHCAYEFKAARVVFGGTDDGAARVVDLTDGSAQTATLKPKEVAWIRTQKEVSIPPDRVGLWIQTNSLSRQGLLLMNSTLVEPGYRGYLAAHLANLGAVPVTLGPSDTVAKLVLLSLDRHARDLVEATTNFKNYDAFIEKLAARSHPSFLRMNEFATDLSRELDRAVETAKATAQTFVDDAVTDGEDRLKEYSNQLHREAKEKLNLSYFAKLGGAYMLGIALGIAFFSAAMAWALPTLRSLDSESAARIEGVLKQKNLELQLEIDRLKDSVEALEARQNSGPATDEPSQPGDNPP